MFLNAFNGACIYKWRIHLCIHIHENNDIYKLTSPLLESLFGQKKTEDSRAKGMEKNPRQIDSKCGPIILNPFSAGIDFRRQNLKSKVDPRTERIRIFIIAVDP